MESTVDDLAASRFTADELKEHETLQAGLDLLDQGLTVCDAKLRVVAWNKAFLRLLDFPPEMAYPGAPFESFIRYNAERGEYGPGDPEEQIAMRVELARGFQPHYTERTRPNGRLLAVRGEPLPQHGFVTLYTDITEQRYYEQLIREQNAALEERVHARTAELEAANERLSELNSANSEIAAALRRSEERLRLITDRIPALVGYFDSDEIYRYANKGYSDWFGKRIEDIVGHPIETVVGDQVYGAVRNFIRRALRGEQVSYEYARESQGEAPFYARSTLVPEIGPDGRVLGCFVASFDITEQKRTQATLVQAQKMEAIGQLTGGLAHDFNNMLTVVIGNLAALRDRRAGDPEALDFVEPALDAARRGAELIKRLLSFSRQQPLEPRPVEIISLVQSLAKLIRRSLPESIAIRTCATGQSVVANVDPHQLENALLNLALNARDAMPNGGQLLIESSLLTVDEITAGDLQIAPGRYIQITVSDNGIGMDGATVARVFEPFFTTKPFGMGSGLGMSMVYGFIKQSGGGVRIRSRQAKGTVVALLLPQAVAAIEENRSQVPRATDTPPHTARLVLLVEDDASVRRLVRLQLVDLGYSVLEAETGPEAVDILENVGDVAIVISDVVMPGGMDGRALAQYVRTRRPDTGVILMSGYTDGSIDGDCDVPLLAKPFSKTELATVLSTITK